MRYYQSPSGEKAIIYEDKFGHGMLAYLREYDADLLEFETFDEAIAFLTGDPHRHWGERAVDLHFC